MRQTGASPINKFWFEYKVHRDFHMPFCTVSLFCVQNWKKGSEYVLLMHKKIHFVSFELIRPILHDDSNVQL